MNWRVWRTWKPWAGLGIAAIAVLGAVVSAIFLSRLALRTQNPYQLAVYWGDRSRWPLPPDRTVGDELHELATMAALAGWLTRWLPVHMHAALLSGASVPAVAAAAGVAPAEVRAVWVSWVDGQVHLWQTSNPARPLGVSPEQAAQVRAVLDVTTDPAGGDPS